MPDPFHTRPPTATLQPSTPRHFPVQQLHPHPTTSLPTGVLCAPFLGWAKDGQDPPSLPTLPLPPLLTLCRPRNQAECGKYFCTLCNEIFMHHKGLSVCVPLIIEGPWLAPSDEFSVEF